MATAANDLDSILDSLHALQMDLDECLQQREPAHRPAPAVCEAVVAAAVPPAPVDAPDVAEADPDDFPPPPPPEELLMEPPPPPPPLDEPPQPPPLDEPPQPPPACFSPDATAASISEVMSNDSGIQDSPQATRRSPHTGAEAVRSPAADSDAKTGSPNGVTQHRVTWSVALAATELDGRVGLGPRPVGFKHQTSHDIAPATPASPPIQATAVPLQTETLKPETPAEKPETPAEKPETPAAKPETPAAKPETKQERKAREEREKRARKELLERQKKEAKRASGNKKQPPVLQTSVSVDVSPTSLTVSLGAAETPTKLTTTENVEGALPSLMSVTRPQQQQLAPDQKLQQPAASAVTAADGQQGATAASSFFQSTMQERIRVMNQLFDKAYLTRMAVRIHCLDRTTKMLALDERSKTGLVCTLMANKNLVDRRLNHAIVEKLPDMKMERIVEDHELLGDTLLAWPSSSKNLLFFEERDEKFGAFTNPGLYLGDAFAIAPGETGQQQLSRVINDLFEGEGSVPPMKEYLHVRSAGTKVWKKRMCILRSSGIYAIKKGKTELKCLTCLAGYHLFTTLGGWTSKGKIEAPTPHGFALKALQTHSLQSKQIHFFSATSELAMKRWCTAIRIAMIGNQYYLSYQFAHKSADVK